MDDDYENTTTDEIPQEDIILGTSCKLFIDIKPRKVPKSIQEAQLTKLTQIKKHIHALRLENESLKAENQAMKKNIDRYYELVLQARERKKLKGNQNVSVYTISAGIILACTVHFNTQLDTEIVTGRKLLFFEVPDSYLIAIYAIILIGFLLMSSIKSKYSLF
jgi:regulator of replication initiation timing